MMILASLALPLLFALFGLLFTVSRQDLTTAFREGATEGLHTAFGLLPTLVMLMTAVSMFSASGAPEYLATWLTPILSKIGIPPELTPLILIRPLSGSGSTALLTQLYETYGADSDVAFCASVLTASSDTLLYVVAVYLSGVKKTRHTLLSAFLVMLLGIVLSCLFSRLWYPGA